MYDMKQKETIKPNTQYLIHSLPQSSRNPAGICGGVLASMMYPVSRFYGASIVKLINNHGSAASFQYIKVS